jgi:hypothetical protein
VIEVSRYIDLPKYFDYYNNAFKIIEAPNGGLRAYVLDCHTGKFRTANSRLRKVLFAMGEEISPVSEDEFVTIVEENRSYYLHGDGTIFAIYDKIDAWFKQKDSLSAAEWRKKRDLISELRRRTFSMWEEEFTRQAAGERPSFKCESVGGAAAVEKFSRVDPTPDLSPEEAAEWFRELGWIRAKFDQAFREAASPSDTARDD